MKEILIKQENIELLVKFISKLEKERLTFRYYENRDIKVIKNHVATIILITDDEEFIGYGHLDNENEIIWLGVVVLEKFQNMGYGNILLKLLLEKAKEKKIERIRLSVDKKNLSAVNLYKKFGFLKIVERNQVLFLEKVL